MEAGKKVTWPLVLVIVLFLAIAGYNLWQAGQTGQKENKGEVPVPVRVVKVALGTLDWNVKGAGELLPSQAVQVYPKIPGEVIEKILVDKGDQVRKGQPLVLLDKTRIKARLRRAQAQVEVARSNLIVLEKDYQRMKNLVQTHSASKQKLDHLRAELDVARANHKAAQAALQELQILEKDHTIFSPLNGVVLDRFVDPGNLSSFSQSILLLGCVKKLKLQASLAEDLLSHVRVGTPVSFSVDSYPGKIFQGQVSLVYPALVARTRTVRLELEIPNDDLALKPGMYARLSIFLAKKQGLVLVRDALNQIPGTGSFYVFVVQGGRACLRNVLIGLQVDNQVEVVKGLKKGEVVVVRGQDRLKDGQLVQIMESAS